MSDNGKSKLGGREAVITAAVVLLGILARLDAEEKPPPGFGAYPTPYYVIYTDLDLDTVREAAARMTAMAEEYQARTRDFSGRIRSRLPFYLYSKPADYAAAGGIGDGMYSRGKLMAVGGRGATTWQVVQHEGFHQYVHSVVTAGLPTWVDEGLAEYFGVGVWTGDNFLTGVVPPERLKRVKQMVAAGQVVPFLDMLMMSRDQWNSTLVIRNYDQAWSMVHFLAHADEGRYQQAFSAFIMDVSKGRKWTEAFLARFGRDVDGFQKRYSEWWTSLAENPTADRYTEATVLTLTSFLARSTARRQTFADAPAFFAAARAGKLQQDVEQWLPPGLLTGALAKAAEQQKWSLGTVAGKQPTLVLTRADGTTFTGSFVLTAGRVTHVEVKVDRPKPD